MKTLHKIQDELTFLQFMEARFRGIHEDWHYRGDQIWYKAYIGALVHEHLRNLDYWQTTYKAWIDHGAKESELRAF